MYSMHMMQFDEKCALLKDEHAAVGRADGGRWQTDIEVCGLKTTEGRQSN